MIIRILLILNIITNKNDRAQFGLVPRTNSPWTPVRRAPPMAFGRAAARKIPACDLGERDSADRLDPKGPKDGPR